MNHELVHVVARRHCHRRGPALAPLLPRQGPAAVAEPRVDALQLPHRPALHRPALVSRGRRRLPRRPGWAAGWAARRAATTRWCSGRWCATTPTSTTRSASSRAAPGSTSRSARTPTSTARASSPGSRTPTRRRRSSPGCRRDEGSERYYADQFEQVFGLPLEQAWQDWIAFEHEFQRRNLAEVRKYPITPHRNLVASAVGSVSRMYYDEATGILYGGLPLSRRRRARRRARHARRQRPAARRHQGRDALHGHVVRLRPGERHGLLHQRQLRAARPDGGRRGAPARSACCSRTRASARSSSIRSTAR